MKLVNNFMAGVQAASFAEAMALIDAAGLDHEKAVSILNNGAPGSPMVKRISVHRLKRRLHPQLCPSIDGQRSQLCGCRGGILWSKVSHGACGNRSLQAGNCARLRGRGCLGRGQIVRKPIATHVTNGKNHPPQASRRQFAKNIVAAGTAAALANCHRQQRPQPILPTLARWNPATNVSCGSTATVCRKNKKPG